MKIISAEQTRQLDAATIQLEPIASVELMERASQVFTAWFTSRFTDTERPVYIFCGPGNNGGDGLVVARLLYHSFYDVQLFLCKIGTHISEDHQLNLDRLPRHSNLSPQELQQGDSFPTIPAEAIVIDAIFGSGLSRPVEGYWAKLLQHLNQGTHTVVAIDIPSGMFADEHTSSYSIEADYTFSFELPKLAFCFPENHHRIGQWFFKSIGLHQESLQQISTSNYYLDHTFVKKLWRQRSKFAHKGTYGHALLMVGSRGKVGAAILAARACLRSGAGLLTVHAPGCAYDILQISLPEAMVSIDEHASVVSSVPDTENYSSIGAGCGLGTSDETSQALEQLLAVAKTPLVLDADALNLIARKKSLLGQIPKESILSPHPKEFERLFGASENDFHRNEIQRKFAKELGIYIILKGAHSCIACPDGTCYFNSTGNPGMATGGSGDVLTGMLTGLLAQKYSSKQASLLGVYLHGLAGDLAIKDMGQETLLAGDLVDYLGKAYLVLSRTDI